MANWPGQQTALRWFERGKLTFQYWSEDDGYLLAAAVAYYVALSFFPILLVLISGLGLFLKFTAAGRGAEQQVLAAVGEYASPNLQQDVAKMLEHVQDNAAIGGPLGLLGLLLTASLLFAQFQRAFDRIWNVESPKNASVLQSVLNVVYYRVRAFLMLLGLGCLILVLLVTGVALSFVQTFAGDRVPLTGYLWPVVQFAVSVTLNAGVFALLYKTLPQVPVSWREAFHGGVLTAVTWEIGRILLANFLIGGTDSPYGIIGSFLAVMLWAYYAAMAIFLGAEYIQAVRQQRGQRAAGGG